MIDYLKTQFVGMNSELVTHERKDSGIMLHTWHYFLFSTPMFLICPKSYPLCDAEWFNDLTDAKEDALDWSVDLSGETVIVYKAIQEDDGAYEFKKLFAIFA